jgi:hypothetical protein
VLAHPGSLPGRFRLAVGAARIYLDQTPAIAVRIACRLICQQRQRASGQAAERRSP